MVNRRIRKTIPSDAIVQFITINEYDTYYLYMSKLAF